MLEVLSIGDRLYATLQQMVGDQKYKDAIVKTLDAEGIAYHITDPIDKGIPPFELPE